MEVYDPRGRECMGGMGGQDGDAEGDGSELAGEREKGGIRGVLELCGACTSRGEF